MFAIERLGGAKIHGHAMLNDAILLENSIQNCKRPAAIDHVVFRDDLEPIDHRLAFQDVLVMRNPQADADAVLGMSVKSIGRHVWTLVGGARFSRTPGWGWLLLGAVGGATAFALARVLALAAVVA